MTNPYAGTMWEHDDEDQLLSQIKQLQKENDEMRKWIANHLGFKWPPDDEQSSVRERCPSCGDKADWQGQFQCRCTGR